MRTINTVLSFCVAWVILNTACNNSFSKKDEFNKINLLINEGKSEKAISRLNKIITKHSEDGDFYAKRGDCFLKQNFYLKAIEDYLHALQFKSSDSVNIFFNLGKSYSSIHKDSLAIAYFQKSYVYVPTQRINYLIDSLMIIKTNPYDIWSERINLSEIPIILKNVEKRLKEKKYNYYNTIQPLGKIIKADSTNGHAYFLRAFCYSNLYFYSLAISDNIKAINYNYNNQQNINYNLGCIYFALENDSMARFYFNKAGLTCYEDAAKFVKENELNNIPWDNEVKKFYIINKLLKI